MIRQNPQRYEAAKNWVKSVLPVETKSRKKLSHALSRLHQKYVQDYVFIHVNKCGGTSVERALGIPFVNHDIAIVRRAVLGPERWSKRFKFTICRNPFDRTASTYFHQFRHDTRSNEQLAAGFSRWLEDVAEQNARDTALKRIRPQHYWIADENGEVMIDAFYKLEELRDSVGDLSERLGFEIRLPALKAGRFAGGYENLLTQSDRDLICEIYARDFEYFGYDTVYGQPDRLGVSGETREDNRTR